MPHELGLLLQAAASLPLLLLAEANTDSLLTSLPEPHKGHFVPFQSLDLTSISLFFPHFPHSNS
jgi:hypothetical protein